jgi:hypothetical protein
LLSSFLWRLNQEEIRPLADENGRLPFSYFSYEIGSVFQNKKKLFGYSLDGPNGMLTGVLCFVLTLHSAV